MTVGQELVAYYVDECVSQGRVEMVRIKGQVASHAKKLFDAMTTDEGLDAPDALDLVKAALREFIRKGCTTALRLAEISVEITREGGAVAERPSSRRAVQEWVKVNGWPTGATFVRGSGGGTYVYDPLGTERLPSYYEGWTYKKPTFDDILLALDTKGML